VGEGAPDVAGTTPDESATHVLDRPAAGRLMIRGGVLRVAGYVVGVLVSAGAAALVLRHLGVTDTGRYVTVMALVSIAGGISEAGLSGISVREYTVREGAARERLMRHLLGLRIALTSATVLVAVGFAIVAGYDREMVLGTALAGIGFLLMLMQLTLAVPLTASLRLGTATALDVARQVGIALAVALLVLAGAGLIPLLAAQIPATIAVIVVTARLIRRETSTRPGYDRREWAELLRDILPYSAAAALSVIYFRVVAVLMELVSTADETGYFGAAFRVMEVVAAIPPVLVTSAFLPLLARAAAQQSDRLRPALAGLFEASLALGAWMALCLWFGAQAAIDVVGGPDFAPSVEVLQLLAPTIVATFLVAAWGYGLLSLRRHRGLLVGNAIALTVAVALTAILAPAHGAVGGAIALVCAEFALALVYGFQIWRHPRLTIPFGALPRVAAATAAAAGATVVSGLPSVPAVMLASVVYAAVLWLVGGVPPAVRAAMRRP
jgi:O-antigen/teichoic acid export membrane protein